MTDRPTRRGLATAAAVLPATFFIGSAQAQAPPRARSIASPGPSSCAWPWSPAARPTSRRTLPPAHGPGAAVEMAKSIAAIWSAEVVYVESTFGNSVLDVQSNKIDIAFALNPTPQRALAIGFTRPYIVAPFGCVARPGFAPKTWGELNKPDIRIAFDLGSLHETCARRFAPKAQLTGFKSIDNCILALQSGRVDAEVLAATTSA